MFALYAFFSVAEAGDRLFLPIAGQQPLTQSSETVYVPVTPCALSRVICAS
jgi:hypothetical protein